MTWRPLGSRDQLAAENVITGQVDQVDLVVYWNQGQPVCFRDQCSHQDVRLSDFGHVEGNELICFAHGARFAMDDGRVLMPPACESLTMFPCRIHEDHIEVMIEG